MAMAFSRIENAMALKNSSAPTPTPPISVTMAREGGDLRRDAGAWPGTRNSRLIATV